MLLIASHSLAEEKKEPFVFKNDKSVSAVKRPAPRKPVKIKLKRLSSGAYTWELSGDNLDDIINTDRRLKKIYYNDGQDDGSKEVK